MHDPVCGTTLKKGELKTVYLDCSYYFCSELCKQKFDANPGLYLSDSARGA